MSLDPALIEQVRSVDPDRYRAALTAPEDKRAALLTLYAFNLEVARTPWRASEPHLGQIRLQWWVDAVEEIYAGQPPRRHEIVTPLAELIRETAPPKHWLIDLIEARGRDIDPAPMLGRPEFERYISATAGAVTRLAALMLSGEGEGSETDRAAGEAGYAHGVASLLRAFPALAALDRLMIPPREGEVIDRARVFRGETPPELARALADIARDALDRLASARNLVSDRRARPALLAGWRAEATLRAALRSNLDAFAAFSEESPFRRDLRFVMARLRGW